MESAESTDRPTAYVFVPVYCDDASSLNGTIDNQPGAGRTLDLAYQYFGRKLERAAGAIAHRLGYGPLATGRKIQTLLVTWYHESTFWLDQYKSPSSASRKSKTEMHEREMTIYNDPKYGFSSRTHLHSSSFLPRHPLNLYKWSVVCRWYRLHASRLQGLTSQPCEHPYLRLWYTVSNDISKECEKLISFAQ